MSYDEYKMVMGQVADAIGGRVVVSRGMPFECWELGVWRHVEGVDLFGVLKLIRSRETHYYVPVVYGAFPHVSEALVFEIAREKSLDGLINKAMIQDDIQTGYVDYDKAFLVRSNDESWLRAILNDELTGAHAKHNQYGVEFKSRALTVDAGKQMTVGVLANMFYVGSFYTLRIQEVTG